MNTETQQTPSIQDIVRQETDNGMLIVRFLISVIEGEIPDTKLWHRLDATRQLRKLGFDYAAALETVRAEPVEAPHEAVRAEPVEAPTPDTNGTDPSPHHSGIPATAGTGEEAGIQWGGDTPATNPADADPESVRAEPVEAPNPDTNGASLRPIPQSGGAAVPPLPQGEGRGEGDTTDANGEPATDSVGAVREPPIPAPDPHTNGTGSAHRHSGIPATAGTGEEAGIQRGGGAPLRGVGIAIFR